MPIRSEYLDSVFIAKPPIDGWPNCFHIITAENPLSGGQRSSDNTAMTELRRELSRRDLWKHRVDGASRDWKHREKGYAISNELSLRDALALARQFQQNAIFTVDRNIVSVSSCTDRSHQQIGFFSERLFHPSDEPLYRIYVVRLDDGVLNERKFRDRNPAHQRGKPCYYVGMTSLSPDERFAQHKAGIKDCKFVITYGKYLARKKFENIPLLSRSAAEKMEVGHAALLRSKGYAVWQA